MDAITIPIGTPLTFAKLRELNPEASADELSQAFAQLPKELRDQAWSALRLRVALDAWGDQEEGDPGE